MKALRPAPLRAADEKEEERMRWQGIANSADAVFEAEVWCGGGEVLGAGASGWEPPGANHFVGAGGACAGVSDF
jgi:hypothetical protein